MSAPLKLSKADARRVLVRDQFEPCATAEEAFRKLRSIQFDPIAPVGCNHDLVLQARVPGYKIGDWEKLAYKDRFIYDGWDKQASLVPYEGWPVRRFFHALQRRNFDERVFSTQQDAVAAVLGEIRERGAMQPKDFEFQAHREEWKGTWYGPSVTKQVLRALWHTGEIMTTDRRKGQHVYDLTERVVPKHLMEQTMLSDFDASCQIMLERHQGAGFIRPTSAPELWSYTAFNYNKREILAALLSQGEIVPVEIEGVKANATPELLRLLDEPPLEPSVSFVAPLDQLMWDRKLVAHLFGFDYVWEIYTPEVKRRWGYYVLPIRYGDDLVARVEFWARKGTLEIRAWHYEAEMPAPDFLPAFEKALREFMNYSSTTKVVCDPSVPSEIRDLTDALG